MIARMDGTTFDASVYGGISSRDSLVDDRGGGKEVSRCSKGWVDSKWYEEDGLVFD